MTGIGIIYVCGACGQHSLLPGLCAPCMRGHKYVTKQPRKVGPVQSLDEVSVLDLPRLPVIGFTEIENSLAGGFVRGSVLLLHGGPGVGKSTLGLQLCEAMGRYQHDGGLYVSAEQMIAHVKMMAMRVNVDPRYVRVIETQELEDVVTAVEIGHPIFVVIDSLQELHLSIRYDGSEIVAVCQELVRLARETNAVLLLICHETKDDSVAGPRRLEHIVDGMVNLEGWVDTDGTGGIRWRVHSKYRFGPVPKDVMLLRTLMGGLYERGSAKGRGGSADGSGGAGASPKDAEGDPRHGGT
jgi:DNA repair protein RadA/Sms